MIERIVKTHHNLTAKNFRAHSQPCSSRMNIQVINLNNLEMWTLLRKSHSDIRTGYISNQMLLQNSQKDVDDQSH